MRAHPSNSNRWRGQVGFSMVEMLMTAFVMAIGILGLTMLQVLALKGSRGGRSLSTAVAVGEHVMDNVEMEGRLSWLNVTDPKSGNPLLSDLPNLKYVTLANGASRPDAFNSLGGEPNSASLNPAEQTTFYRVTTTRNDLAPAAAGTSYALSDFSVRVEFTDQVNQASQPITRMVILNRRISHG